VATRSVFYEMASNQHSLTAADLVEAAGSDARADWGAAWVLLWE
jgi:hypothetical protein